MEEKKSILVVDDEARWLSTIKLILESDFDLILTTDPSRAIEVVKAHSCSLVIMDKRLPGISGLEVLRQMLKIVPNLRAIVLTGYADVDSAVESTKIGALGYISKGTNDLSLELKEIVKEALERSLPTTLTFYGGGQINPEDQPTAALIAKGENSELEFKSSVRWDMQANKSNRELEKPIVKTIAAFMNSEKGGTLLIGIDDTGAIVGLQRDYQTLGRKRDRDGYENFLTTILLDSYGKECSPLIQITFHQIDGQEICQVGVKPSPKPVFVRDDKGEHLFIRTGNSTRLLSTREAIEYCKIRWK